MSHLDYGSRKELFLHINIAVASIESHTAHRDDPIPERLQIAVLPLSHLKDRTVFCIDTEHTAPISTGILDLPVSRK